MSDNTTTAAYPEGLITANLDLVGLDGNAFAVLGVVRRALRDAGNTPEDIKAWSDYATDGDYDHLVRAAMRATGDL